MSKITCALCPVSTNGNIVHSSTIQCHNQGIDMVPSVPSYISLVLFYSFVYVCARVCRSIQFYYLHMFVFLPPQSRHWAVPLAFQPGSILLPYYNHTISPLPATPSPWQLLPCPLFVKFSHFRMLHTMEHNRKSRK